MAILYLHIGTPKTGTTAIQYFLWSNRSALKKQGFCFPKFKKQFEGVPEKRNAHFLVNGVYKKKRNYEDEKRDREDGMRELLGYLDKNEHVILSDEAIWHSCNQVENFWQNFVKQITQKGHQLKVIVYLRRQDEFIQSYWKYRVLSVETKSFPDYVKSKKYDFFPLNYYTHLSHIAESAGQENILVRVYEKGQYKGPRQTIISDFMDAIGLLLDERFSESEALRNTNIDFICTEVKRRLNKFPEFTDKNGSIRNYLSEITRQNQAEGKYQVQSLFTPRKQDEFMNQYLKENEAVAREFLGREDGILFYAPMVYADEDVQKLFQLDDYIKICGQVILALEKKNKQATLRGMVAQKMPEGIKKTKAVGALRQWMDAEH